MQNNKTGSILILALLCSGCASSKLELELAIYKDDPFQDELNTKADIDRSIEGLEELDPEVAAMADGRIEIARSMVQVFKEYHWLILRAKKPQVSRDEFNGAFEIQDRYLVEFEEFVRDVERKAQANKSIALHWLERYRRLLPEIIPGEEIVEQPGEKSEGRNDPTQLIVEKQIRNQVRDKTFMALKDLNNSLSQLVGPNDTSLEKTLFSHWDGIQERVESKQVEDWIKKSEGKDDLDNIRNIFTGLKSRLNVLGSQSLRVDFELENALSMETIADDAVPLIPDNLLDRPLRFSDSAARDQFAAFSLLATQVERLQDPSDPLWKVVTDPMNAEQWNVEFSGTYFRAEGNSSVVVVRDSPMEFRTQQGNNDPTALVQAQLQVSRAIADAAITVAGATTGVSLGGLKSADKRKDASNGDGITESEEMARRKAIVEEKQRLRAIIINAQASQLRSYRTQLQGLDAATEAALIERLLDNLINSLKADAATYVSEN